MLFKSNKESTPDQTEYFTNIHPIKVLLISLVILFGMHLRYVTITQTVIDHPLRGDAVDYFFYAKNLSDFGVYSRQNTEQNTAPEQSLQPDSLRSPGFPAFASLFKNDNIESQLTHTLVTQTLIQIFTFLLFSWVIIKSLGFYWGVFGVTLLWTFPHFITMNTYFLSESLFISQLALTTWVVWWSSQKQSRYLGGIISCGLLLGLAAITRPSLEYFPFFVITLTLLIRPQFIKPVLYFSFSMLLPILLWKIRNIISIGTMSDPTLMINALYHGSFPNFMYNNDPNTLGYPYRYDSRANEVYQGIGVTLNLIIERIKTNPLEYIKWYLIGKQTFFWQWNILEGQGEMFMYPVIQSPYFYLPEAWFSYVFNKFIHAVWVVIGLIGSINLLWRFILKNQTINVVWLFLSVMIIYAALLHIIVAPFPRYGIPFKLFLIPLSILTIKEIVSWAKLKLKQCQE